MDDGPTSRFFQREMSSKDSDYSSMHLLPYNPPFPSIDKPEKYFESNEYVLAK